MTLSFDVSSGLTVSPATHTFNSSNWDIVKNFRVRAEHDDDGVNQTLEIIPKGAGANYDGVSGDKITVTVVDDDTPDLEISQSSVTVGETATLTNAYTIKPTTQPTGTFEVTLESDDSKVTVSPTTMTFDGGNWQTAQQVQVTAGDDDDAFNNTAMITHTASMDAGQNEYDGVTGNAVTVTVDDNDTQGVNVVPTTLTITEGQSQTYNISLDTLPVDANGAPDTVTVTITNPTNTDISASPTTVTLNSGNWKDGVNVTVSVAEDTDTTADMETITHAVSGADYGNETAASVTVTATDNDTAGVDIPTTSVNPAEGGTATYTVELLTQPTGTVTVTMISNNSEVTLSDSSLEFDGGTWDTPQTVTVTAAEDADAAEDTGNNHTRSEWSGIQRGADAGSGQCDGCGKRHVGDHRGAIDFVDHGGRRWDGHGRLHGDAVGGSVGRERDGADHRIGRRQRIDESDFVDVQRQPMDRPDDE